MNRTFQASPVLVAAAHAAPLHDICQDDLLSAIAPSFAGGPGDQEQVLSVFGNSRIQRRQFVRPLDWYRRRHAWAERNRVFQEEGLALMVGAVRSCLDKAGCQPREVDQILFVTSTGLATPTLDASLIQRLGFRPSVSRLPIWGLGCAAGAVGLSRAADLCLAHPQHRVLVVALELCSLSFQADDLSKKNLVAASLFGDGAGAALVAGADAGYGGPRVRASLSHLFPDSARIMGWDFLDEGMALVLSPQLPALVREVLGPLVEGFLSEAGLRRVDLRHYIAHPGGARVLDACREALGLAEEDMALCAEALAQHGNISSVTVLAVLERWFAKDGGPQPGFGLVSAFGPGFSAELLLLEV